MDATQPSLGGSGEAYCATCTRSFPVDVLHCPHDGSQLIRFRSDEQALIGKLLDGRWEIVARLGEGGMGAVYRAKQTSVDRPVAIKVLHASVADNREAAKRFLREVRLASRLNAPNIVTIIDFGQTDDGLLYLVMELVTGSTLVSLLEHGGPMGAARAVAIADQLCDALACAHAAQIIHRDLKPGNVIVDGEPGNERVKVLDFGLAKSIASDASTGITNTNALLGTPMYMAPEQIESKTGDARTDLYALGCIMYEMLAGRPPFVAGTMTALFAMHLHSSPDSLPADVPEPLAAVVYRLLAKSPDDRFASAVEVRAALANAVPRPRASVPPREWSARTLAASSPNTPFALAPSPAPTAAASTIPAIAPRRRARGVLVAFAAVAAAAAVAVIIALSQSSPMPAAIDAGTITRPATDAASLGAPRPMPAVSSQLPVPAPAPPADAAISPPPLAPPRPPRGEHHPRPATVTPPTKPASPSDGDLPFLH